MLYKHTTSVSCKESFVCYKYYNIEIHINCSIKHLPQGGSKSHVFYYDLHNITIAFNKKRYSTKLYHMN